MEHFVNFTNPAPVFEPPANPTRADVADFEAYIARELIGRSEPDRSDLELYLRRFPGHSLRDWKGKSIIRPLDARPFDKAWHKLKAADVHAVATATIARELPQNVRQAAARDPALIWNPLARKYRLRLPSDPYPPEEVGGQL